MKRLGFFLLTLALGSSVAGSVHATLSANPAVGRWIEWSRPGGQDLSRLADWISPAQVPLLVQGISREESETGVWNPAAYEAAVRWQFWMGKEFDAANRGVWSVRASRLGLPASHNRRVSSTFAALELVSLRALAEMAERRALYYDAQVWWREHSVLRSRLLKNYYDCALGAYVDLDSLGRRITPTGVEGLMPVALGASAVVAAGSDFANTIFTRETEAPADPRVKVNPGETRQLFSALRVIDPGGSWKLAVGTSLWPDANVATMAHEALRAVRDGKIRNLAREALVTHSLTPKDTLTLTFDGKSIEVPVPQPQLEAFARGLVCTEFLRRTQLFPPNETDALLAALNANQAGAMPDSLPSTLGGIVARWRAVDLQAAQALARDRTAIALNDPAGAAAFRFDKSETRNWVNHSLERLTEDLVAYYLQGVKAAAYKAALVPKSAARGSTAQLDIDISTMAEASRSQDGPWTATWTDGRSVQPPFELALEHDDETHAHAEVTTLPSSMGVWWLVVQGPLGRPSSAPGLAVVQPFVARVAPISVPTDDGTTVFEVEVHNQVNVRNHGRLELAHPLEWMAHGDFGKGFDLEPSATKRWRVRMSPGDDLPPGLYDMEWQFYDDRSRVANVATKLSVPFQWLHIGPFANADGSLNSSNGPDREVDFSARYNGAIKYKGWTHLGWRNLQHQGWVQLMDENEELASGYALTAFTSISKEIIVRLESDTPALVILNGTPVARCEGFRRQDHGEAKLETGVNYLMVKSIGGDGRPARFRVGIEDLGGGNLVAVNNDLAQLLDGYAYISGAPEGEPSETHLHREQMRMVPIVYDDPGAATVSVVGSFNGWSPGAAPMKRTDDGRWKTEIRLAPGRFEYKLAVNGKTWIIDPENPLSVSDGFGGRNSVLVVE